jgi:DNA (cytosine-5)-methyltransferase 1
MKVDTVPIDSIRVPEPTTPVDEGRLQALIESIRLVGLLVPILVTPELRLLDGRYRLLAGRALGWDSIEVHVLDYEEARQQIAAIDVHIQRRRLTKLEFVVALGRRRDLYYALHPEAKPGSPDFMTATRAETPKSERTPGFCQDASTKIGISDRHVERLVKMADDLSPAAVEMLAPTKLASNLARIAEISRLPHDEQVPVVELLLSKDAPKTVTAALRLVRGEQPSAPRRAQIPQLAGSALERAVRLACQRAGFDLEALGIRVTETSGCPHRVQIDAPFVPGQPDLSAALAVAWQVAGEIATAKSVWQATDEPESQWAPVLTPDEIAALPAGQLEVEYETPGTITVKRAGVVIARLPITRKSKGGTFILPQGNTKGHLAMPLVCSVANGCLRWGTGFQKSDLPCYSDESGSGGCYANTSLWAAQSQNQRDDHKFNVVHNGIVNDLMTITLPRDGDATLDFVMDPDTQEPCTRWRIDCGNADASVSLALGIAQQWASENPSQQFVAISSEICRPSDAMLCWAAALPNLVVGVSVSAWLSDDELESRLNAIRHLLDFGVQTRVWICTDPAWDNWSVADRVLDLVPAKWIIESPHTSGQFKNLPLLGLGPACGDARYDGAHRRVEAVATEGGGFEYRVPLGDGSYDEPRGQVHARCLGCERMCGLADQCEPVDAPTPPDPLALPAVDADHGMLERTEESGVEVKSRRTHHTPFPSPDRQRFDVQCGDIREVVPSPAQVHCVVTSPPYYQMKTYGESRSEIGHEATPQEYIDTLCDVFDQIPLHPLGSVWVNIKDKRHDRGLLGIPERFVVAMEDRGWKLLDRVVWAKSALMPDGTTLGQTMMDPNPWRLNDNGWEHLLRFSRTARPWSDPCAALIHRRNGDGDRYLPPDRMTISTELDGRVAPNVWLFGPDRSRAAHVAPWPEIVCELPIALTCPLWVHADGSLPHRLVGRVEYDDGRGRRRMGKYGHLDLLVEGGRGRKDTGRIYVPRKPEPLGWTEIAHDATPAIVFDPFCGTGTTGVVALRLGRSFLGCDLYEENCRMAREKLDRTIRLLRGDESPLEPLAAVDSGHSARPMARQRVAPATERIDTDLVPMDTPYTVVDAFAGAGGLSEGFHMAGYQTLLAIEMDEHAAETYRANFPDTPLLEGKIEWTDDDTIVAALGDTHVDVLAGGPPCQPFSTNGKRDPDDHRAPLLRQMVRLAKLLRPHFVVIENVCGLLTMPEDPLGELQDALAAAGYGSMAVETLLAAEYGVPQLRKRIIVVANRHGLAIPYPRPLYAESDFVTVDEVIADLRELPQGAVPNHHWPEPRAAMQARISALSHGEPLFDTFKGGCRRLRPDRPAFTIMANNGQPHVHPHEHRFLSVREMARVQGFSDMFVFHGSIAAAQQQVGNAVPPPLARAVALALRPALAALQQADAERMRMAA